MSVGLHVSNVYREIGAASFFNSFFSTVSANLEPAGWGSRFPTVMRTLYEGRLPVGSAAAALAELDNIHRELAGFPPSMIVWDYNDRSLQPPWGDDIDPRITSLANYFVTSDGKDLFVVFKAALSDALREQTEVVVQ
jgi:hypothetical protein